MKLLQVITLIFGFTGTVMGFSLLFSQADRGDATKAPCMDANGEPTC